MKPDNTTMKEVKERADERLLAEERRLAEAQQENKSLVDDSSIPFQEKVKSFNKGAKDEKSVDKIESKRTEDLRRDSALFEGVSQGLIHLDAAFTAAPQVQGMFLFIKWNIISTNGKKELLLSFTTFQVKFWVLRKKLEMKK